MQERRDYNTRCPKCLSFAERTGPSGVECSSCGFVKRGIGLARPEPSVVADRIIKSVLGAKHRKVE